MKTKLFYVTLFVFSSFGLFAQKGPMKASSHTTAAYMREIPALSQMKNIISAKNMGHVAAQEKRRGIPRQRTVGSFDASTIEIC